MEVSEVLFLVGRYALVAGAIGFFFFRNDIKSYVQTNLVSQGGRANHTRDEVQHPSQSKKKTKSKPKIPAKAPVPEPVVPAPDSTVPEAIAEEVDEDSSNLSNTSFARSMRQVQAGTSLKKTDKTAGKSEDKKKKNKKTKNGGNGQQDGTAEEARPIGADSAAITNGAQAPSESKARGDTKVNGDGGQTGATKPDLAPAPEKHTPAVAEVQPAFVTGATGMSTDIGSKTADTLRITEKETLAPVPREDTWVSVPTKKERTKEKVAKKEETQKQRQRTAENERRKEAVAEAEAHRKKLEEAQRRRAREARGEPAKNGESYRETAAPSKSAWNKPAESNDVDSSGMLDTLEPAETSNSATTSSNSPVIIGDDGEDDVDVSVNGSTS